VPIGPLLMLAVESITPTAEAKGVRLTASIPREPVQVWADQDRLQQVLWNLLSNAVKFTSSGDRIDVSMELAGPEVCICVRDTGIGIAPDFLPHVFERFRQGDGSSTRMHGGLGLGLSIARHLVEAHGGRMNAESPGEGQGSTFTLYLPVREAEKAASPIDRKLPRREPLLTDAD
jgi:signal transduction histidine kinase